MRLISLFRRPNSESTPSPDEDAVMAAAAEFLRKEKLLAGLTFLDPEVRRAATDAARNRFLDVLFSHLRS